MATQTDRMVSPREDGQWTNKRLDGEQASSVHDTQAEAIESARSMLHNQGGGELTIQGTDGKIREKISVPGQ